METVGTQFGIAASADFEEMTWTFKMPENFKVWAGEFAIVDKLVYDELLEVCKASLKWCEEGEINIPVLAEKVAPMLSNAIKKATE